MSKTVTTTINLLAFAALTLDVSAATTTTNGTFGIFDHEEFYSFESSNPPDGSGNVTIGSEQVFGLSKFDPALGTLNKITVNAGFDYTITSEIEVFDLLDYDVSSHSASYSVSSDGGGGDRGYVYVRYNKGSSSFFMTNEFFFPSAACSGGDEPCANAVTSAPTSFDAPVDILNTPPQSGQIDLADFVGVGSITSISMAVLLPQGSIWTTDNVLEADGRIGVNLSAGTVSIEYDFTPTVVPIPAAVWLFGSAIGLLGWTRRKS